MLVIYSDYKKLSSIKQVKILRENLRGERSFSLKSARSLTTRSNLSHPMVNHIDRHKIDIYLLISATSVEEQLWTCCLFKRESSQVISAVIFGGKFPAHDIPSFSLVLALKLCLKKMKGNISFLLRIWTEFKDNFCVTATKVSDRRQQDCTTSKRLWIHVRFGVYYLPFLFHQ